MAKRFSIWSCIFLVACSAPSRSDQNTSAGLAVDDLCKVESNALTPAQASNLAALRSAVESAPIYRIAATPGVSACNIRSKSGSILIEYRFKGGGWFHVKRDPRIEYMEQVAHVQLASEKNPVAILADAERKAFGENGCGIEWQNPDARPLPHDPKVTETLFYGDVCNCRAGFRRDAGGRVVELMLRSAC